MPYRSSLHSLLSFLSSVFDGLRGWVDQVAVRHRKFLLIAHTLCSTSLLSHHPGLFIVACGYNLYPELQLLSIEWQISGCAERAFAYNQSVDLYLNDASKKVISYDPQKLPIDPSPGLEYIQGPIGFRTEHRLSPAADASDSYTFHLFAFAIDPSTNLPVEITRLDVPDSLFGFTISSSSAKSTMAFSYKTPAGDQMMDVTSSVLMVEIERSNFSRGFETCIIATSWILTLGSAYIAVKAIRNRKVNFMVVFLHASVALAVPSLRKLRVSPPPSGGSADMIGFFSQIAIVALSSLTLVCSASKAYLQSKEHPHNFKER